MNKILEMSKRMTKGGRKNIKMILLTIHNEGEMNRNGITWKEEYVNDNIDSLKGMPICATFLDEEKSSLFDHGYTETVELEDGKLEPLFENSESVGVIEEAKIEDVEIDGVTKRVLVGYGYLFYQRYKALCDKLQSEETPTKSSIEIMGKDENNRKIVYEDGYKEQGRVPMVFDFSATALLGVLEADENCYVLEVAQNNNKEDIFNMTEEQILEAVSKAIATATDVKTESDAKITELNSAVEEKDAQIVELNATIEQVKKALADMEVERDSWWAERDALQKELGELKAAQRLAELNSAISEYSEDEQKFAESEINSFKENPLEGDIEAIKSKICVGIVGKQKEDAKIAEQNSVNEPEVDDIFSGIDTVVDETNEDVNIF